MRLLILLLLPLIACAPAVSWRAHLRESLPALGHRNWIVIADSAYPWQTSPGIETVVTRAGQLEVVRAVLEALAESEHVRPDVVLDAELDRVSEGDAPGIDAYRRELAGLLAGLAPRKQPHEEILARLDADGQLFHVLLLKTDLALPYTSVFVRLECGYWSAEAEERLRRSFGSR
jgi:hypothetical protein